MAEQKRLESRRSTDPDLANDSVLARLPAAVPVERRNWAVRYAVLRRIYREFEEMPGLSVSATQAARLFGLPPGVALRILERLAAMRVLRQTSNGQFTRRPADS